MQGKAGQSRAKPGKAGQSRAKPGKAGQSRAKPGADTWFWGDPCVKHQRMVAIGSKKRPRVPV
jgi:hypothetical protein